MDIFYQGQKYFIENRKDLSSLTKTNEVQVLLAPKLLQLSAMTDNKTKTSFIFLKHIYYSKEYSKISLE